jgi:hypothetical protein
MTDITKSINHVAPDALVRGHKELKVSFPQTGTNVIFLFGMYGWRLETDILLSSPSGLSEWI